MGSTHNGVSTSVSEDTTNTGWCTIQGQAPAAVYTNCKITRWNPFRATNKPTGVRLPDKDSGFLK